MMQRFFTAPHLKRLGRLCKIGAWGVALCGALYILVYLFMAWNVYLTTRHSSGTNNSYALIFPEYVIYLANALAILMTTTFYFIVLFVASTIFTGLATTTEPAAEDIVYEAIEKPGKVQQ